MFVPFDTQPQAHELPSSFPTPFGVGRPHPLALRAAVQTQAFVDTHPTLGPNTFTGATGGKMLGVLVVRTEDEKIGYLRAFAGQLDGRWVVEGFVPPAFNVDRFEGLWAVGRLKISELDEEIVALREGGTSDESNDERLAEAIRVQQSVSRSLHAELHDTYRFTNNRGRSTTLRQLFEPRMPPGGAGDCAGPKLLVRAFELGAEPLALAEFWWGDQPTAGDREHGTYYPACQRRCATILPFMLEGMDVGLGKDKE